MVYKNAVPLITISLVVLMSKPAFGAEVSCVYDSNSEWPWLDTRVCQTEERPLILDDDGQPICSDPRADKDGDGWGWENNHSCVIDSNQAPKQSTVPGLVVTQEDLVVFEYDFESAPVGALQSDVLNQDWHTPIWHLGLREGRATIVSDAEKGKALQVLFPAHKYGADGAVAFLNDLSFGVNFNRSFEELYVSYDVKFSYDFDFVRGGKLPGLCGYNRTQEPKDGCNTGGGFPTGYDGWSARGMWREDGKMENYVYHADQFYEYGDDEYWSKKAQPGKWHTIQHRVVLNTVGEANGIVEAWLDGEKVLSSNTMLYRKTADIGINLFYFSTFYGGADPSWAPSSDQYIYFDNFRIATTPMADTAPATEKPVAQPIVDLAPATPVEETPVQTPAAPALQTEVPQPAAAPVASVEQTSSAPATQSIVDSAEDIGLDSADVAESRVVDEVTSQLTDNTQEVGARYTGEEPELAAANEVVSGGGIFYGWLLGILALLRRKRFVVQ